MQLDVALDRQLHNHYKRLTHALDVAVLQRLRRNGVRRTFPMPVGMNADVLTLAASGYSNQRQNKKRGA
jgi:hypothetical protein